VFQRLPALGIVVLFWAMIELARWLDKAILNCLE